MRSIPKLRYIYPIVFALVFGAIALTMLNYSSYREVVNSQPITLPQDQYIRGELPQAEPTQIDTPDEYVKGQMILSFKEGVSEQDIDKYVSNLGGDIYEITDQGNIIVEIPEGSEEDIERQVKEKNSIAQIEKNYYATVLAEDLDINEEELSESKPLTAEVINNTNYTDPVYDVPALDAPIEEYKPNLAFNDTEYINQWAMQVMGLEEFLAPNEVVTKEVGEGASVKEVVQEESDNSEIMTIAVIDSGICIDSNDLEGKIVDGYDFVNNDETPEDEFEVDGIKGHGCAVSGIIGALTNNNRGIAGATNENTKIMPLKVVNSKGLATYSDIADAIVFAVDNGANIINISVGGQAESLILEDAIEYAEDSGVVVVAAAGNTSSDEILYPANYKSVTSVGSVSENLFVSGFSSQNKKIDFWAPGESIVSLTTDGGTDYYSGTSYAAPYITVMYANGLIGENTKRGGVPHANGNTLDVNFEQPSDGVVGWGISEEIDDSIHNTEEEYATAQSSTKCVTRYSVGWWAGAYCYIQGTLQTGSSTQYKIVDSGKTYNLNLSNVSHLLNKTVRVEVKYNSTWSFSVLSVSLVSQSPIGVVDSVSDTTLLVRGWAFDPDTPSSSISVHVYIGGPAGSGAPGYAITANSTRNDVNNAYGITGNHGFVWRMPDSLAESTKDFYVYAIDTWGGGNPLLSPIYRVTFRTFDYEPPSAQITSLSSNIYKNGKLLPQGDNSDKISESAKNLAFVANEPGDDPINSATGYLDYTLSDLSYEEVNGQPFELLRSYNSNSTYSGILGQSWQASFDMKLVASVTNSNRGWTVFFPDGHGETFYDKDNTWESLEGSFSKANSEIKGQLVRYGSTGGTKPYEIIYIDAQNGNQYKFNAQRTDGVLFGKLHQVEYPNGTKINYSYDSAGKLVTAVEEKFSRKFTFTFNGAGKLSSVTDLEGNSVSYNYNVDGRLSQVTNPIGGTTKYFYNASGKLASVIDANNIIINSFEYDSIGRITKRGTGGENWDTTETTRMLGDVNGDGKDDIVGVDRDDVYVSLSSGNNFEDKVIWSSDFGYNDGWDPSKTILRTGDVNGDGKDDIIGFGMDDVYISLSTGSSFDIAQVWYSNDYSYNHGDWTVREDPRMIADANGDGKDDIIGFNNAQNGIFVSLSNGSSFATSSKWRDGFAWDPDLYVRTIGDVNGDGKADIVGYGSAAVYVSLSNGNEFVTGGGAWISAYTINSGGWHVDMHPRFVGDADGDGKDDVIGISNTSVSVATSNGTAFVNSSNWIYDFNIGRGWEVGSHPRLIGDVDGDGKDDIVGFWNDSVKVVASTDGHGYPTQAQSEDLQVWSNEFVQSGGNYTYTYEDLGNNIQLTTITDPNGNSTKHKHNDKNYLVEKIMPNGDTTSYTYDDKGQRLTETFPDGKTYSFEYDTKGNRIKTIYPNGYEVSTEYNTSGNPSKVTYGNQDRVEYYSYDSNGNLTSTTDPENNTTVYDYNDNNQLELTQEGQTYEKWGDFFSGISDWNSTETVMTMGDVNGDGKDDIVGFGLDNVYVALANNDVFDPPIVWISGYTYNNGGWRNDYHVRTLGDVNGDGKDDIVGFAGSCVVVSFSNGTSFSPHTGCAYSGFTYNAGGWRVDMHPRMTGDVNGDGKDDIIGFGNAGAYASLSNGTTFNSASLWIGEYGYNAGGWVVERHPRFIRDINGDGKDDVIGISNTAINAALSNGSSFVSSSNWLNDYSYGQGWQVNQHPRLLGDLDGNGKLDMIGLKDDLVFNSYSKGNKLSNKSIRDRHFSIDNNWNLSSATILSGDVDGDGMDDIIGIKDDGIYALKSGKGTSIAYDSHGYLIERENISAATSKSYTNSATGKVLTETDENGHTITYTYDADGNRLSETDARGNTKNYQYDLKGNLIKEIDKSGTETTYTYNEDYNILTKTIGSAVTTYEYDAGGRKIKETSPEGSYKVFSYDVNGRTTKVETFESVGTSLGAVITAYNSSDTKASQVDANGVTTTYTYDDLGRLSSETRAGKTKYYTYDFWANKTSEIDWEGNETRYTYDKNNQLINTKNQLDIDASAEGTTQTYDTNGNIIEIKDSLGNVTKQFFDTSDRLVRVENAKGQEAIYDYDQKGNLISQTNFAGELTTLSYDSNDNLISKTDNLGNTTLYTYNSRDLKTTVTDSNGYTKTLDYDQYGQNVAITNSQAGTQLFTYDLEGNLISETDELANVKSYSYDALGRRLTETYSREVAGENELVTKTVNYDGNGNAISLIDEKGNETTITYDSFNNISQVTNPDNTIKSLNFDAVGNLLNVTHEDGSISSFEYDAKGNKTKDIDQEGNMKTFRYNVLGKMTKEIDGFNNESIYEYDVIGNLVKVTDRVGNITTFTYESGNRLASITKPNGLVTTYSYDALGRKNTETQAGPGLSTPIVETYSYDANGNLTSKTDANGNVETYSYDSLYRLTNIDKPLDLSITISYDPVGNVVSQVDEGGNETTYSYDASGNLLTETNAIGASRIYRYDKAGNLVQEVDENLVPTYYSYDSLNRKTETKDRDLEILEKLTYDDVGNVVLKQDANGYNTGYEYYLDGNLKKQIDPEGHEVSYVYDANGNLISETNQLGAIQTYSYNLTDQVTAMTDYENNTWSYEYDELGNLISITDPKNNTLTNEYDALGRKTQISQTSTSMGLVETSYVYDANGNLLQTTNPMGGTTQNTYDALNRLISTINPEGEAKQFDFDAVGNLISSTDAENNTMTSSYDDIYRKIAEVNQLGAVTTYSYDNVGNLLQVSKPEGNTETYTYDDYNQLVSKTDGEGNVTTYGYDKNGNMTSETRPNGTLYAYTYDSLDRNTGIYATPDGGQQMMKSEMDYDSAGRLSETTDARGNTTTYSYDSLDRLVGVTDALQQTVSYTYDALGNMTSETNANSKTTSYTFDEFNNLIKETDPLGNEWNFEYDLNGNKTKEVDANGNTIENEYDLVGRLLSKKYLDQNDVIQPESVYFEYDNVGSLTKAYKADYSNDFSYDDAYRIISAVDSNNHSQSFDYDTNGNLSEFVFPDGKVESYAYNLNDQIDQMDVDYSGDSMASVNPTPMTTTFDYDVNGNLTRQENPDNSVITKTYDPYDQIVGVHNYKQDAQGNELYTLAKYSYTLNNAGQKLTANYYTNCDADGSCDAATEVTTNDTYSYDEVGRLIASSRTVSNPTQGIDQSSYMNTYTYDAAGNRLTFTTNESGVNVTTNYSYNDNNQLISENNWEYTYDANGNRLSKTHKSNGEYINLGYDRANQIISVDSQLKDTTGSVENYSLDYSYDALGRRVGKTNDVNTANNTYENILSQSYTYQGKSWDMAMEKTDMTSGTDVHTNFYTAQIGSSIPTIIASEDVLERNASELLIDWISEDLGNDDYLLTPDRIQKFSYYQRDDLGSVVGSTNLEIRYSGNDSTGSMVIDPEMQIVDTASIVNQSRTNEYGKKINDTITTGGDTINFEAGSVWFDTSWASRSYSGQVYDRESQTYYYGSRNYDPANGTWTKLDTYRGEAKNPLSRNRYLFVEGDPVNNTDKYGYSKTLSSILNFGIDVYRNWDEYKQLVKDLYSTAKEDPKRSVAAFYTGVTTAVSTGNPSAARKATHIVLENNKAYQKVQIQIAKKVNIKKQEKIQEQAVKEQLAIGVSKFSVDFQTSIGQTQLHNNGILVDPRGNVCSAITKSCYGSILPVQRKLNQNNTQAKQGDENEQVFGKASETINSGLASILSLFNPKSYKSNAGNIIESIHHSGPRSIGSKITATSGNFMKSQEHYNELAKKYHVGDSVIIGGTMFLVGGAGLMAIGDTTVAASAYSLYNSAPVAATMINLDTIGTYGLVAGSGAYAAHKGVKQCQEGICSGYDKISIGANIVTAAYGMYGLGSTYQSSISSINHPDNLRAYQMKQNKINGAEYEDKIYRDLLKDGNITNVRRQISGKASSSNKRVIFDFVATDKNTGKIYLYEAKSSQAAPLTRNQKLVYPLIREEGGSFVGKGKYPYSGGVYIEPTNVNILRPQ